MKKDGLKPEMLDITTAKAIAIILVVVGHILAGGESKGNEWFTQVIKDIYLFHMPFFMFISGFLFFRHGRIEKLIAKSEEFISSQAIRLLLPFILIGIIIVLGKIIMQKFVHVDNIPEDFWTGFVNIIWYTRHSASVFLWYIFALFIYSVLSLFLFRFFKYNMILWVALGAVIYLIPQIYYFHLDKLTMFFLFFVLGGYARIHENQYHALLNNKLIIALCTVAFFATVLDFRHEFIGVEYKYYKLSAGLLCIPVLMKICEYLAGFSNKIMDGLLYVGRHTYIACVI